MNKILENLIYAEEKASELFAAVEKLHIISPGRTEKQVSDDIFDLANVMFGIDKYWHKRIVRSGVNTLCPYNDNPPDLTIQDDDIVFLDFGPIFEDFEADFGRTYVVGNDPLKLKLKSDVETAWHELKQWFDSQTKLTCSEFYDHIASTAENYGWEYGNQLAGHLIGQFPHEKLEKGNYGLYVHPENHNDMLAPDADGNKRHWILEIHFIDREKQIGGFFEQLLT